MKSHSPTHITGRLLQYQHQWKMTFGESWATNIVSQGYSVKWQMLPPKCIIPITQRYYNIKDTLLFKEEINDLLLTGAIQEMDINTPCFFLTFLWSPRNLVAEELLSIYDCSIVMFVT